MLRLKGLYFFSQNPQIWIFLLEIWKLKVRRKFHIAPILKLWIFSQFFWSFCLVLGCRGSLRLVWAGFVSFWLDSGFSKYKGKIDETLCDYNLYCTITYSSFCSYWMRFHFCFCFNSCYFYCYCKFYSTI